MSVLEGLLGADVLADAKKGKVIFVDLELLLPNSFNIYETNEIESLAQNIKDEGILQPLIAYAENDEYRLHTGHRRNEALNYLNNEGSSYSYFGRDITGKAPIILISKDGKDDLELKVSMIRTNAYRQLNDQEKNNIIDVVYNYVLQLEEKGTKPKGRTREIVSEITGFTNNYVKQYLASKNKESNSQDDELDVEELEATEKQKTKPIDQIIKKIEKLTKDVANAQLLNLEHKESEHLSEVIEDLKMVLDQLIE